MNPTRWMLAMQPTLWLAAFVTFAGLERANANDRTTELKIMTFNVWSAEDTATGRQRIINTIQQSNADIVGFQEMSTSALRAIATTMGFYYYDQGRSDESILSRYPIVGVAPQKKGVEIELTPGQELWVFNTHLYHAPYGPYQLNGITYNGGKLYDPISETDRAKVISDQVTARGAEVQRILSSVAEARRANAGEPIFLTGDFNEASHLDWTAAAATAGVHVAEIAWPASTAIVESGFRDSWRELYPDEVTAPGRTWSPVYPSTYRNAGDNPRQQPRAVLEPQDRIDMVYYQGSGVEPRDSRRAGPIGGDVVEELEIANYPSDHNTVTSGFGIQLNDATRLTFRSAGAAGSPIRDGYGSHSLTSPDVDVEFGIVDDRGDTSPHWQVAVDAQWPTGGALLDGGTDPEAMGHTTFVMKFEADQAQGIRIEGLDLGDVVGSDNQGHRVVLELWSDQRRVAAQDLLIEDDQLVHWSADPALPVFGSLEVRITPLTGDNHQLVIDNVQFRQIAVPEPAASFSGMVAFVGWIVKRRSRRTPT